MTIEELALVINQKIEMRFPDVNQNYMYNFDHGDVKQGHALIGTCGRGKTPDTARKNYVKEIKGQTLIFHAMDEKLRREVIVPQSLT